MVRGGACGYGWGMVIQLRAVRAPDRSKGQPSRAAVAGLLALLVVGAAAKAKLDSRGGVPPAERRRDVPAADARQPAASFLFERPSPAELVLSEFRDAPASNFLPRAAPAGADRRVAPEARAPLGGRGEPGFGDQALAYAAGAVIDESFARGGRRPGANGGASLQVAKVGGRGSVRMLVAAPSRRVARAPERSTPSPAQALLAAGGGQRPALATPSQRHGVAAGREGQGELVVFGPEPAAFIAAEPGQAQPLAGTGLGLPGPESDLKASGESGAKDSKSTGASGSGSSGGGSTSGALLDAGAPGLAGAGLDGAPSVTPAARQGRLSPLAPRGLFLPEGDAGRLPATVEEADRHFITQWGPTAFNSGRVPYGYNDCGPAAVVMVVSALGLHERPEPEGAAAAIDAARDAAMGYDTDYSTRMGFDPLARAVRAFGGHARLLSPLGVFSVEEALERGSPLILGGYPWEVWGAEQRRLGNYLNSRDPGGHFVTLLGKTAEGRYLIGDPLVVGGTLEITAGQLSDLLQGFGALEVWRDEPASSGGGAGGARAL